MMRQLNNNAVYFCVALASCYAPSAAYSAEFDSFSSLNTELGTNFTTAFTRTISGRLGINAFDIDLEGSRQHETSYDLGLGFESWSALVDWRPFSGNFRLSGGVLHNSANDDQTVDPYTGLALSNSLGKGEFGSLNGVVDTVGTTPYLGIGWGNALNKSGRLGLVVDLGLVLQDDNVNLSSDTVGSNSISVTNSLDDYNYLPVFSLGLSYQFN